MLGLSEGYLRETVTMLEKEKFYGYLAVAKSTLATLLAEKGQFSEAKKLIEEVNLEDVEKTIDPKAKRQQILTISGYEGKIYGLAKEFGKSEAAYRKGLRIVEEMGYEKMSGYYQYRQGLGEALFEQGKKEAALEELLKAQKMYTDAREKLEIESRSKLLDITFSVRKIDETIKLIQK